MRFPKAKEVTVLETLHLVKTQTNFVATRFLFVAWNKGVV